MSWLRAPTSGRSRPRRSSRAPTATSPSNGWRSSRRARAWTAWWRGSRADTRAAASGSWGTSPISADWFAHCSPTRAGRSWSCARARPVCSSFPARWGGARRRSIGFSVRNTSGCSAPRMTKRPDNLLAAPAPRAAHRIALSLLDAATAARERLPDTGDAEALHDFRVAMRRLRSTLRAYQPQLEAVVPPKLRRRLRDLARATGVARDVEVQISWLERRRGELPPGRRAGVPWLLARLTERRERAYRDIRERIGARRRPAGRGGAAGCGRARGRPDRRGRRGGAGRPPAARRPPPRRSGRPARGGRGRRPPRGPGRAPGGRAGGQRA